MPKISTIKAREIIDSRGNPTVEADVIFEDGSFGRAAVPSGASTGSLEALEKRDGDKSRFCGKGVLVAVNNVNNVIKDHIIGFSGSIFDFDKKLLELDGTENKSNLGANAILALSLAYFRALANANKQSAYYYLHNQYKDKYKINIGDKYIMPVPMMNIINGGAHADNPIDIQEFMIMPAKANSMFDAIRMGCEVFHNLKSALSKNGHSTNVGDEGGFAPNLRSAREALDYILEACSKAGYTPGDDIFLALDVASSEFYKDGKYHMDGEGKILNSEEIIRYYEDLVNNYPIKSIEDPMSEHDHQGWIMLTKALGERVQLVGDDLFVTNPKILAKGIDQKMANAILIKPNQIGSLTETLDSIHMAQTNGFNAILSHRSGETEDNIISHIAVGTGAGQIKTGSLSRSDRLAKYNELIRIEEEIKNNSLYGGKSLFEF